MPSVSKAQHRMMAAACRGNGRRGLSKDVSCEFMHADRGKVARMPEKKRRGKGAR